MGSILGEIPIVGDLIAGKKDPGQAAVTTNFNSAQGTAAQNKLMDQFSAMGNQDFSQIAQNQTNQQEAQARQNVQDQTMRAQQAVTQRGLGNTSMGLNAILGQGANLGNQIGQIRANQPGLEQGLRSQNLNMASNGINSILGQQSGAMTYTPAQASKGRQGGLLGAAGGIAGGIMGMAGGPMGSAMGAQAGMGIGNALSQA